MARSQRSRREAPPQQLDLDPGGPDLEGIIEFDPEAPPTPEAEVMGVAQAEETAGTLRVSDDFFAARDELLDRLTGARPFALAEMEMDPGQRQARVLGVGIAFKQVAGALSGDVALQVLVEEKLPSREVDPALAVPSSLAGLPTDVLEVGTILPHVYTSKYRRPVPGGVSIGHGNITAGTFGCLVVRNNNHLCMLGNNHVLADCNRAKLGDPIYQPGKTDAGNQTPPANVVATLEEFVPLNASGPNLVDAAVAFTSFKLADREHVTYRVDPRPVAPALGMTVMKNGRTTQSTIGTITGLGFNGVQVPYAGVGLCAFRDQIVVTGVGGVFSRPGDSGSLIVTANTKQPVALLFAGTNNASQTFANRIDHVMQALGIKGFV